MPRSNLTIEQFRAAALLLGPGVWYDRKDHTFMMPHKLGGYTAFCADTLENADFNYAERCRRVRDGEIGAVDAIEEIRGGKIT